MTTKELILAASGEGEHGRTKAAIGMFWEIWGADGSVKSKEEISLEKPVLNIFRHGGYVQVDLKFKTKNDIDLRMLWSMLEKFCNASNSVEDEAEEIPALTLSIYPLEFDGEYYMLAINPIFHTLQPNGPAGDPTVIRLVYAEEDFLFYEMDKDSAENMAADVKKEIDGEDQADYDSFENQVLKD